MPEDTPPSKPTAGIPGPYEPVVPKTGSSDTSAPSDTTELPPSETANTTPDEDVLRSASSNVENDELGTPPPTGSKPAKSGGKKFFKFLLILILLAAIAGGVYYFMFYKKPAPAQPATTPEAQ